jgi:rifampicin phosphotransferase
MTIGEILDLNGISAGMIGDVGGKAASLGELTRAGFPVPPGFCVTTDAYRRVAATAGVDTILGSATGDDLAVLARARILEAPVPDGLATAIAAAYRALGADVMVAVRSSATAEDLPFASFAGQQDTYLGVLGEDAVIDAVRRCWASLWTDRAGSYRASQGIDNAGVRLAVVVQTMVHSQVAGVLFTANPVTGRRREAVIDASPGLGEAVVSGAVTPDHLVVDTATRRILDRRSGDKRFAIHAVPGGGTQQVSLAPDAGLCLTDRQVIELAVLGDRVETRDGVPQDIEWAIDGRGKLWLTQARPITTLFPLPDADDRRGLRSYFCFSVAQGLYRPLTPMGLAAFRLLASSAAHTLGAPESADRLAGPPAYAEAGQRVFLDLTGVLRSRVGRAIMPRVLDLMETRSATLLRGLFDRPEFSVVPTSPRPALRRAVRIVVRYRLPVRLVQAVISPAAAHRRVASTGAALAGRLADRPGATPAQRLDHVETILFVDTVPLVPEIVPGALAGFAMFGLAARLLRSRTRPGDLQVTLKGLARNITTEMDLELWSLT